MDYELKRDIEILKKLNDIKVKYLAPDHIELMFKLDSLVYAQDRIIESLQKELAEYKEAVNKLCEMGDEVSKALEKIIHVVDVSCQSVTNLDDLASSCSEFNLTKEQRDWMDDVYSAYDIIESNIAKNTMQDEQIKRLRGKK